MKRRPRAAPPPATVITDTSRSAAAELADIIRYGADMLDDVEDAVHRCRTEPDPSSELARTCGSLVSGYLALRTWLNTLPPTERTRRVDELLNYPLILVGQASLLAFRPRDRHWERLAAEFGDGLGAPAVELRSLARRSDP